MALARAPLRICAVSDTPSHRFLLAVDDGGEFFVAAGSSFGIGHLRSPTADLPFLADVEADHARLSIADSFHTGPRWSLTAQPGARVELNGRTLGAEPVLLAHGDVVQLAPNLTFRFRAPDPASSSAVLDLTSNADLQGARHVLLLAPGKAGLIRIGSRRDRHVPVPELASEVTLEVPRDDPSSLIVRCSGGVRVQGGVAPTGPDPALSLPCPPPRSISLTLGARPPGRAPFGITVWPVRILASGSARSRPA